MIKTVPRETEDISRRYQRLLKNSTFILVLSSAVLLVMLVLAVSAGAVNIPFGTIAGIIMGKGDSARFRAIILGIRLPQALTAVVIGGGLAVSGSVMQTTLRNPLASPFTLGVSNAAAFGAAFSVMILGSGVMHSSASDAINIVSPYRTTIAAFLFSLLSSGTVLLLARLRKGSPETMILAGVTLSSLFTAGTMFLQYFADDVQLAAMVFWTFGDTARSSWRELFIITSVTAAALVYFHLNCRKYNAFKLGDDTAQSLGISVDKVRILSIIFVSLVSAVSVAFIGVIGFVGLVAPHITKKIMGENHRFYLPGSVLAGSILLLAADTAARLMLSPRVLPVAVLTSFLGAPVFIFLLLRKEIR